MNEVAVFNYESQQVRSIVRGGGTLFCPFGRMQSIGIKQPYNGC